MANRIQRCRVGKSSDLISVLDLGEQCFDGIFPKSADTQVTPGRLELVWSPKSGLLQLAHDFDLSAMYGSTYGYRSGLNQSMVQHLTAKTRKLTQRITLAPGDIVLDIGSNDGTLLGTYQAPGITRIGIDPSAEKFRSYYSAGISLVTDFFSRDQFISVAGPVKKARLITSIAMFYDLPDPIQFARDVHDSLADDGIWHFEQSYMPSMLKTNSYDTVCHEHVEYYSLSVIDFILKSADLQIVDVEMNAINGGSFAVTAQKKNGPLTPNHTVVKWMLNEEHNMGLHTPKPYRDFEERVFKHRESLVSLVRSLRADGKKIFGYGASTKGNVTLQFCGFTPDDITCIADVNPDKFGCFTPGTKIPIVSEKDARAMKPDYYLVLPWHFRNNILSREADYLAQGGHMIFPMPEIEIV
jgi:hypothetical protein